MRLAPRLIGFLLFCVAPCSWGQDAPPKLQQPFQVVDLNIGEVASVRLENGSTVQVKLIDVREHRDPVCFAVRRAEVRAEVDGRMCQLVSANYNLPQTVGRVQIDCPITKGYNENGTPGFWGLDKDARLRLWPADSLAPTAGHVPIPRQAEVVCHGHTDGERTGPRRRRRPGRQTEDLLSQRPRHRRQRRSG